MSFARRKRLLLGWTALVAPLPLPLNGVVAWPVVALFWLAVGLFLFRAYRGSESWLPAWAMNLLAVVYLPFFFADLTLFWRGQVLQPLVHLALFTLAVKLFALKREADKWHAALALFFVFLAAMGSSVHPSVVLYHLAMLGSGLLILVRFAGFHQASRAVRTGAVPPVPVGGFVAAAVLIAAVGAVPLFVLLPRLRQPYVVAPVMRAGVSEMTGFTDRVTLDTIGRVRSSSSVAFRFSVEGPATVPELRFKGATYDLFRDDTWRRGNRYSNYVRRSPEGWIRVAEGQPRGWMEIWLKRAGGARLALPVGTVALDLPYEAVSVDDSGVISLAADPSGTFGFRAGFDRRPATSWPVAGREGPLPTELEPTGVTPRMEELAAELMGEGPLPERVARLEDRLRSEYSYTLDLGESGASRPIERFLFATRAGHCEYFATSMVLLLRSQGIAARLVTGYYGAEYNPFEHYFIVRLSNAHAWVEAWLPETGWMTFDPTPEAGLPLQRPGSWSRWLEQVYDYLVFRWDRYVLTYGFYDQAGAFFRLRELWMQIRSRFGQDDAAAAEPAGDPEESTAARPAGGLEPELAFWRRELRWLPPAALLAVLGIWLLRRRGSTTATAVYRGLRDELARRQVPLRDSTPPLEVARRLRRGWPEAAERGERIVGRYLEESFAARALDAAERRELDEALREVRRRLRRSA